LPALVALRGAGVGGVRAAAVGRSADVMMRALQIDNLELSIVLTDDEEIRHLNRVYRRLDRPTDVLAFAQGEGELAELAGEVLGDIVVSVPTARRQARERGATLFEEVTMLTAHGLLHLLGWDHETPSRDRAMRAGVTYLCDVAAWWADGAPRRGPPGQKAHAFRSQLTHRPAKVATKTRARRQ
jgi:probable rRNA maturation factor